MARGLRTFAQLTLELGMGSRVGGRRLVGDPGRERVGVIRAQWATQAREARLAASVEANQARGRRRAKHAYGHILGEIQLACEFARVAIPVPKASARPEVTSTPASLVRAMPALKSHRAASAGSIRSASLRTPLRAARPARIAARGIGSGGKGTLTAYASGARWLGSGPGRDCVGGIVRQEAMSSPIVKRSVSSYADTMRALLAAIERRGLRVFARIDHAAAAHELGMELEEEEVVLFGNPSAGTPLMQSDRSVGIELPLRILVWRKGETRCSPTATRAV